MNTQRQIVNTVLHQFNLDFSERAQAETLRKLREARQEAEHTKYANQAVRRGGYAAFGLTAVALTGIALVLTRALVRTSPPRR